MQKITPFLWFDDQAEEAVNFYISIFKNSRIISTSRYDEESNKIAGRKAGSVMTISFEIEGQEFTALNGGPIYKFTESVSFVINCDTQEEIDHYWNRLVEGGGTEVQCGWLKDKYGLSWQVTPRKLGELMSSSDPARSERVMGALLKMKKIIIYDLQKAYENN